MTMTEKILARHSGKAGVRPGDNVWANVDMLMTHDVCGPGHDRHLQARVRRGRQGVGPREGRDHSRSLHLHRRRQVPPQRRHPARVRAGAGDAATTTTSAPRRYKGVCHMALPEEGHSRPGEVLFGTDSHTCTAGAFNQFATGIGNTDAAFILGTGKLLVKVPPTMRFVFDGEFPPYVLAKDVILHVIGEIGVDGAHLQGHGVRRRSHRAPVDGRAHDPLQHGDRGGRQERRHRRRRGHVRLRPAAHRQVVRARDARRGRPVRVLTRPGTRARSSRPSPSRTRPTTSDGARAQGRAS